MNILIKICVFLFILTYPVFSQSKTPANEADLSGNEPLWRQALGGEALSLPHVQAQSAVIAIDGGSIRAYSSSGTPLWFYSASGRISPFVTRSREGTSYLSRTNGTLIAINRSGRELWRRSVGSPLIADVIIGWDGRLFVPTDKKISCYTASGNLLWTRIFESPFFLAPKLDRNGGIIFALEDNMAYCIDPFGNINSYALSGVLSSLLSIEQRQVLALYNDGNMEILGSAANWYISAQSEINPTAAILPKLSAAPLAAASMGNYAAALLADGKIAFVSLNEKKIMWESDTHIREFSRNNRVEIKAKMLFDERGVYVLSKEGASYFSIDGRRLWYMLLQNAAVIPAFGDDGILYAGGNDWILYAYKIEERPAPSTSGIYGPAPEGSYGMGRPQSAYLTNTVNDENYVRNKLRQIEAAIKAGRVGAEEPAWTTFLLTVSATRDQLPNRIKALQLLGQIGSGETIPWLADIFRKDSEPLIKAAAASAIGSIGVDPHETAIQTFLYSINQINSFKDEQVLAAIALATGSLCRFSGPPLSKIGITILNLLAENPYSPAVKRQANRELSSLR